MGKPCVVLEPLHFTKKDSGFPFLNKCKAEALVAATYCVWLQPLTDE